MRCAAASKRRRTRSHVFEFSRARLADVRTAFARMIRRGEEKLHRVCELLCDTFLDSTYTLQSVVIGEVETTKERFTLVKSISPGDLYSQTDLDLGNRQLRRLRYHDGARLEPRQSGGERRRVPAGGDEPVGHSQGDQPHQGGGADLEQGRRLDLRLRYAGQRRQTAAASRRLREGRLRRESGRRRSGERCARCTTRC